MPAIGGGSNVPAYTSGGGIVAGGGGAGGLAGDFQKQYDAANKANEERYQHLLRTIGDTTGTVRGLYGDAGQMYSNLGHAARTGIERGAEQQRGAADQDLISRGLGNTTVRSSVMRGIGHDQALQNQALTESLALQRGGLLERQAGSEMDLGRFLASAIEGRNDVGPDLSLMANLLRAASGVDTSPVTAAIPPLSQAARGGGFSSMASRSGGGGGGGGGSPAGGGGGGGGGGGAARTVRNTAPGATKQTGDISVYQGGTTTPVKPFQSTYQTRFGAGGPFAGFAG